MKAGVASDRDRAAQRVQAVLLAGFLLAYVGAALAEFGVSLAVIAGPAVVAMALGVGLLPIRSPVEPALVGVGAGFLLLLAILATRFPIEGSTALLSAVGSFVALGAWALARVPAVQPLEPPPFPRSVWRSVRGGLLLGAGFCGLAAIAFAVGALSGAEGAAFTAPGAAALMAAYLVGGALGGLTHAATRPLRRWPLGQMVAGIPIAAFAYAAVGVAMLATGDAAGPSGLRDVGVAGVVIALLAGPAWGLMLHHEA